MITAGIDAGSRTIKAVIFDTDAGKIVASGRTDQGVEQESLAHALYEQLLERGGLVPDDVERIVATGYGRNLLGFADTTITEITCHARGVRHLLPDAMTVVEIGGQDSKLVRLGRNGSVRDFAMNDRCAAGTGRFLEIVAARLEIPLDELGGLARGADRPAAISSMCVVFAETEIIGLLAGGTPRAEIAAGIQTAIASRVAGMAGRRVEPPVVFTGGVAQVPGMLESLHEVLKQPIVVSPEPFLTGALGAAILAARRE